MGNIVNALSKFGNAFSGLGSTLMVPIIIMVVAMVFRVEWKKALKSLLNNSRSHVLSIPLSMSVPAT